MQAINRCHAAFHPLTLGVNLINGSIHTRGFS